jgi:hypothetical protein
MLATDTMFRCFVSPIKRRKALNTLILLLMPGFELDKQEKTFGDATVTNAAAKVGEQSIFLTFSNSFSSDG